MWLAGKACMWQAQVSCVVHNLRCANEVAEPVQNNTEVWCGFENRKMCMCFPTSSLPSQHKRCTTETETCQGRQRRLYFLFCFLAFFFLPGRGNFTPNARSIWEMS